MAHHGEGWEQAHPTYIDEKVCVLNSGYGAYGYLDRANQLSVLSYFEKWNIELPKQILKYEENFNPQI